MTGMEISRMLSMGDLVRQRLPAQTPAWWVDRYKMYSCWAHASTGLDLPLSACSESLLWQSFALNLFAPWEILYFPTSHDFAAGFNRLSRCPWTPVFKTSRSNFSNIERSTTVPTTWMRNQDGTQVDAHQVHTLIKPGMLRWVLGLAQGL